MYVCICMNVPFYVPIYTYTYVSLYTEEYINYKLTYSHSKLTNFTIIRNKWTVLELLQNSEFLLIKNVCTLITM
jgi:sulfatase maturation enzyme AslB (radical SAM superfamily)